MRAGREPRSQPTSSKRQRSAEKARYHTATIIADPAVGWCAASRLGRADPIRICFITSTPLNVQQGSGTFAGIACLMSSLRKLGAEVILITPTFRLPNYTLQ